MEQGRSQGQRVGLEKPNIADLRNGKVTRSIHGIAYRGLSTGRTETYQCLFVRKIDRGRKHWTTSA